MRQRQGKGRGRGGGKPTDVGPRKVAEDRDKGQTDRGRRAETKAAAQQRANEIVEPTINDIDNATPGSGPCPLAPPLTTPLPSASLSCHIQCPPHRRQIDDHNFSYCAADIDSKGRGEKGIERETKTERE